MTRREYIAKWASTVVDLTENTALFPSVFMAQAALESGNGNSSLAARYNNHFGIKADKSWKGRKVNLQTREVLNGADVTVGAYFRVYYDASDSFRDRVRFLRENGRYAINGVFRASTPEEQAWALQRAGYATDPNYAETIIAIINSNGLKSLDKKKIRNMTAGKIATMAMIVATGFFVYKYFIQ